MLVGNSKRMLLSLLMNCSQCSLKCRESGHTVMDCSASAVRNTASRCSLITERCNAIRTLLQLNSNNCEIFFCVAVARSRKKSSEVAGYGAFYPAKIRRNSDPVVRNWFSVPGRRASVTCSESARAFRLMTNWRQRVVP